MLLTVNVGNSNVRLAVFEKEKLLFSSRLKADLRYTEEQYAVLLKSILELKNTAVSDFNGAIISSVVPELTTIIKGAIHILTGKNALVVGPGVKSGLNILIDNPAQLGADLVASAVAAMEKYPLPCIIISFETALTFSVIDKKGNFRGAVINAGLETALSALTERTALLTHVSIDTPASVIGKNTIHSMQSGLIFGTAAMVEGLASRIEQELQGAASLVATGQYAEEIISNCRRQMILDQDIIFEGLRIIYNKNMIK